jgi:hypothetical protein
MKKIFPYILITFGLFLLLVLKHPEIYKYKFNQNLIHDYLRSQDIEDPQGKIKDRIFLSDNDIYITSGYLYAKGEDPSKYNFQHPPLIKYLFGFSTVLTGNPFWIQVLFGLTLLFLTYFLGTKLFKSKTVSLIAAGFLLIDPVFGGMMNETLLDLGQAVFALGCIILIFFYPESYILQGLILGLFAASKFWSTAIFFIILIFFYKIYIRKEKIDFRKVGFSFLIAFLIFSLTYIKSFINANGLFNLFAFEARVLRFMLAHNSASFIGGPILLFISGFFAPWWHLPAGGQGAGVARAGDWSFLWPVGLIVSLYLALKTKIKDVKFFFYLLPLTFLLLSSTQVPFTRYFIVILPFVYLDLAGFLTQLPDIFRGIST